ncbi:hypothetical protein [Rathayibacter sp. AY1A3]|uniref:hypothetical protein n=1 Tax=Rathayibacter sp. AY1A3 TaxID=2080521 RepID=UPI0015E325D4|nr:hypothetical protein [Rathayibacter sp. AY1A3]
MSTVRLLRAPGATGAAVVLSAHDRQLLLSAHDRQLLLDVETRPHLHLTAGGGVGA